MSTNNARLAGAGVVLLALLVGGIAVVFAGASMNSAQAVPSSESTKKPKPTPTVTGKKNNWGATVGGSTTSQSNRLRPKKPTKSDRHEKSSGERPPLRRVLETSDQARRPFRMNIGICGRAGADGTIPGPARCQPLEPDEPVPPTPGGVVVERIPRPQDVTWEQVLSESRNVLFPGLTVKVQPTSRTLVNLDTIVYTDESKVSTTQVTILGFPVDVEATPMSYLWAFGDGTTLRTTTPGKPYPAKEITHKYLKRGGVNLTLTTDYAARFRVAGGAWQYISGTVPITGPATPLQVREAVPVLVEPGG
ncbi:PKD domain-containing protein [Kribbella sp. CA-247076]|uniref:PKD domain-containing protein n=1 Tax=Kribbella sp. CA-247076 TaxID=3239941 RepID=UPI003D8E8FB9